MIINENGIDYQQFLTRFKWNNLPDGMDSELIERILYFSGSALGEINPNSELGKKILTQLREEDK